MVPDRLSYLHPPNGGSHWLPISRVKTLLCAYRTLKKCLVLDISVQFYRFSTHLLDGVLFKTLSTDSLVVEEGCSIVPLLVSKMPGAAANPFAVLHDFPHTELSMVHRWS